LADPVRATPQQKSRLALPKAIGSKNQVRQKRDGVKRKSVSKRTAQYQEFKELVEWTVEAYPRRRQTVLSHTEDDTAFIRDFISSIDDEEIQELFVNHLSAHFGYARVRPVTDGVKQGICTLKWEDFHSFIVDRFVCRILKHGKRK